jgi:hypothetical protein
MTKRKVYHVVHDADDAVWKGRVEGGKRASVTAETQADVIDAVRALARSTPLAQVKVHRKKDNRIRTEWTYGKDPKKYSG